MIKDIQAEIIKLKKENDICILAHSYQAREIVEVADFDGDSFQLSVMAQKAPQKTVIMCGVRFMAETVKILSPEKTVFLANPIAGCPMAEQMDKKLIEQVKKQYCIISIGDYYKCNKPLVINCLTNNSVALCNDDTNIFLYCNVAFPSKIALQ